MRISKARLLEIIREEVELHENNTLELDEAALEELTDKQGNKILDDAAEDMEGKKPKKSDDKEENELEEQSHVKEDDLYAHKKEKDPETGKMQHPKIEPKTPKSKDILSVKIR
jgi:hypothetical protein